MQRILLHRVDRRLTIEAAAAVSWTGRRPTPRHMEVELRIVWHPVWRGLYAETNLPAGQSPRDVTEPLAPPTRRTSRSTADHSRAVASSPPTRLHSAADALGYHSKLQVFTSIQGHQPLLAHPVSIAGRPFSNARSGVTSPLALLKVQRRSEAARC